MIKNWTIYKIVSPSGRVYIGVTSLYEKRMAYYRNGQCKKQPLLSNSFKKYGFNNHSICIIDNIKGTPDEAHGLEMFWIRSYMSNSCKWGNGLNMTDGGQGTVGYKATMEHRENLSKIHKANPSRGRLGKVTTEEQKEKIRNTMRANGWIKDKKPKSTKEETRLKQSIAKKGKAPWNKGIRLTDAQKVNQHKFPKGVSSWNAGRKFEGTDEERKIKFGAHNIGNTYNKGRKYKSA